MHNLCCSKKHSYDINLIEICLILILLMIDDIDTSTLVTCRARIANQSQLFFSNKNCSDIGINRVSCGNLTLLNHNNYTQDWLFRLTSGWTLWYEHDSR